jgi:hypothetical protein
MTNTSLKAIFLSVTLLLVSSVQAEQYIFPENGQTKEQQQQDEYACHSWATGETGFDPTTTQTQSSTAAIPAPEQQESRRGGGARSALGGAAAGALIAEIGGNDVSNGAAKGAAVGVISNRRGNRKADAQAAQQQQAQQEQTAQAQLQINTQTADYNKARGVCLEAKGYSVSD